eukprot:1257779-Pyramimonas_sp.AAC.1
MPNSSKLLHVWESAQWRHSRGGGVHTNIFGTDSSVDLGLRGSRGGLKGSKGDRFKRGFASERNERPLSLQSAHGRGSDPRGRDPAAAGARR